VATHLVYHGVVNSQGARNVETLCAQRLSAGVTELTIWICSGGGDVNAGVGLFNFLRALPIMINTHCFGICGSIAATIFLAGRRRTATPASIFSLHASTYSEGPRKGQIAENTALISKPFQELLDWKQDRIAHYFGSAEERFLTPEAAKEWGIVQIIEERSFASGDDIANVAIP